MNHNPHNLKVGDTVILDEDVDGGFQVVITTFSPNYLFAIVRWIYDGEYWQVMTNRLTPIKK